MKEAHGKVPVTLLTGFLGAGKTTRLNRTLSEGKSRIAVIENEIGALGVDGTLVANAHTEADGVIELANGCLCCTAEVDLVAALEALIRRHQLRPLDWIIIETTGLADLGPVISLLEDKTDPMAEDLYLDGTVTVVDLCSFRRWAGTGDGPIQSWSSGFGTASSQAQPAVGPGRLAALRSFWRQVAFADQLILSKADQVTTTKDLREAADSAIKILQGVNPVAKIIFEEEIRPLPAPRALQRSGQSFECLGTLPTAFQSPQAAHLEGVGCTTLQLPGLLFQEDGLLRWAKQLLMQENLEVWRIKGLLAVEGRGLMLLQGAGDQVTLDLWPEAVKVPFVVCIGEKGRLQKADLEASLAPCATATPQLQ